MIFASMHEIDKLFCQMEKFDMLFLQTRFFERFAHNHHGQPKGVPQDGSRKKKEQKNAGKSTEKKIVTTIVEILSAIFLDF